MTISRRKVSAKGSAKNTIRAIQTEYAGHWFRSRLEARWAIYLDALGLTWTYEAEGYAMTYNGQPVNYLPDFWVKEWKCFMEIKGGILRDEDRLKATALAAMTNKETHGVLMAGGIPEMSDPRSPFVLFTGAADDPQKVAVIPSDQEFKGRGPTISLKGWRIIINPDIDAPVIKHKDRMMQALDKARRARFEHGEKG